jgi:hypothetical protein
MAENERAVAWGDDSLPQLTQQPKYQRKKSNGAKYDSFKNLFS